jgi:hypothetical protein
MLPKEVCQYARSAGQRGRRLVLRQLVDCGKHHFGRPGERGYHDRRGFGGLRNDQARTSDDRIQVSPVRGSLTNDRDKKVYSTIAPSSGSVVLSTLKIFGGFDGSAQDTDPAINLTTHRRKSHPIDPADDSDRIDQIRIWSKSYSRRSGFYLERFEPRAAIHHGRCRSAGKSQDLESADL